VTKRNDPETLALSVETQNGMEINRTTDTLGRDTGFSLDETDYGVSYAYDFFGRFSQVTNFQFQVSYSYLEDSDLISGMTSSSGFLWTRAYESGRSLITSVENRYGETVISRYDYANDELGRRTARADSGTVFAAQPTYGDSGTVEMPAYNAYSYNTRSEVTGATRRWGTPGASGDLVLGQQYAYAFDAIGNRLTAAEGDTERVASYTPNALNQYIQRTVPDEKDLIGTAPTNVAVTVNQNPVSRQSAYWHHALEVTNAASAAYPQVAITAVYNPPGTNDPDVVTSQTGRVFVAETPEQFTYDDDGNLTQDGRFDYTWNGENRLVLAETREDLPAGVPCVKVEYAYDHQGRMVWKQFSTNTVILSTRTLLWDGYNIVQELITDNGSPITTNAYVWGLDLSGSLQGAGGVGGLLAEVIDGAPYFATFDANGNVTEYVSTNGTIAAHYEYSPFGEIVVQSGNLAASFTHRFSTKPWCAVTGLSEYEFRKYGPGMGRWMSRDPASERGGANHYCYVHNSSVANVDPMGLCALQVIHVPKEGNFPPGIPDNTMGWYEESAPTMTAVPSDCEPPETGDTFIVSSCSATIWTWWEPPEHEMEHYGCLTSLKNSLDSLATDLGCVCKKDACYLARKNLIYAQANYAIAQHAVCNLTLDCIDNGKGKISDPYCKKLVGRQAILFFKQAELQKAKEQVTHACP
jgi:RHS repeat-associated protein